MTLKELRISKGLSQEKCAILCGVPLRSYKRLENNDGGPNKLKYLDCINKLNNYNESLFSKEINKNILIIGAGYVGYTLGVVLAPHNNVLLIDSNKDRVNEINNNSKNKLKAELPNSKLYENKDYIFICVPTNYDSASGLLNMNIVKEVIDDIRKVNKKVVIVIKSTCNIGFSQSFNDENIIYSPEFLREKYALEDMRHPSRIIIGCLNKSNKIVKLARLLLNTSFNRPSLLYMSYKEAESVKLFSNAYLAMRVAYFNELDSFAKDNNLDTHKIISGVSLDPRIGDYYNTPSPCYSGKCLPKDTLALAHQTKGELISSIDRSNLIRKNRFK